MKHKLTRKQIVTKIEASFSNQLSTQHIYRATVPLLLKTVEMKKDSLKMKMKFIASRNAIFAMLNAVLFKFSLTSIDYF